MTGLNMFIRQCMKLAAFALFVSASASSAKGSLKLASYSYPGYDRVQALAPLSKIVEATTGQTVEIVLLKTPDDLARALKTGAVDLAVTNLASYIDASRNPSVEAIAVLNPPAETQNQYRGVLLARREIGVTLIADLKTHAETIRYAEAVQGSTSGALVQAIALQSEGINPARFKKTIQAGSHDLALGQLLSGEADIAALAETPWRTLQIKSPNAAVNLILVWRSQPLPPGPVVCVRSTKFSCKAIAQALVRSNKDSAYAATELSKGWSETIGSDAFLPITTDMYDSFFQFRPLTSEQVKR